MAWVRPKHPKKEPVNVDPTEALVPLLQFFSGRRCSSPPKRKPKKASPVFQDPILRDLQQAQHFQPERPAKRPTNRMANPHSHRDHPRQESVYDDLEEHHERMRPQTVVYYEREPSPPPPPPRPVMRPNPRDELSAMLRSRALARDRQRLRQATSVYHDREEPFRKVSSRWASATTPLDM